MSNEVFQLFTLTRSLAENVELAEALGFPEISALAETVRKRRLTLGAKAKAILEDPEFSPAISLHRRRLVAEVEIDSTDIVFEPPKRTPEWEEPVTVRVHFARWVEENLHHAFVPALGIHVFATRANLISERVEEHVRIVLAGRKKQLSLVQLADLSRIQGLALDRIEVNANRKTPKQIATSGEQAPEKQSILDKMAEELPPAISRAAVVGQAQAGVKIEVRSIPQAAFGMETELEILAQALNGPHRQSVLLVGPPGCGKTALVRELARRRKDFELGQTPFWSTTGARLMSGPIGFGMWQERCQQVCREAAKLNAVLHLGNLDELLNVGKASRGQQSVGSFLRPWLARREVIAIAECTPEQLGAIERNEPHLLSAFQQISVPQRTPEQTRVILGQVFESSAGKATTDATRSTAALDLLHRLHLRYATYSANPGRPLRFLKNLLADQFPEKTLAEAGVIAGFSRETGLPLMLLDDRVPLNLEETRKWFAGRVIGQPEALDRVLDLLAMIKARLARPGKPLASFLFIGPTGTGKTELAKALAEFLFGDAARLARFDLNEFSDPISIQRLIGGPAVGTTEGLLTARVREQPFSVLLLDEFEKADPAFFDLLLQVLGDGRLTDAAGRVADFCNCVIVMTSNLGAKDFQRGPAGFRESRQSSEIREHFTSAVRKFLRPEIFNRLDAIVPFNGLNQEVILAIAKRHLELIQRRDGLRLRPIECVVRPEVAEHLAMRGYDERYGARPLKRALERELLVPLAEALSGYQVDTLLSVEIGLAEGRIKIHVRARDEQRQTGARSAATRQTNELADAIVNERRMIGRLQRCAATSKIEDEVALLESLDRRLTATKWKNPAMLERLSRLPKLRECVNALAAISERARQLETEALGILYSREPVDQNVFLPRLNAIAQDRRSRMREIFRAQFEQPDDVVLAFYSEHRETLLEFAAAYWKLAGEAGEAVALEYFIPPPGGRSAHTRLLRETPKKVEQFFPAPPEKIIGIAMHLRGDLFLPRFQSEAGFHQWKEKKEERLCLIETAAPPLAKYEPPRGIERQGALKEKSVPTVRSFDHDKNIVRDNSLGERPWNSFGFSRFVAAVTEERLRKIMDAMIA
jgi:ATP-dependent Clp protease ATP-binding subunit ClpC